MRSVEVPAIDAAISVGVVDIRELSKEELRHFQLWMLSIIQAYENAYDQFRVGLFDEDRWRMHRVGLKQLFESPGARQWWKTMAPKSVTVGSPEFVALVEEILREERDRGE